MPRSVICSPSHMMNAVPVVSVSMVVKKKSGPGCGTTGSELPIFCTQTQMPADWIIDRTTVP